MKTPVILLALLTLNFTPARAVDSATWLANGLVHPQIILNHQADLKLTADQQKQLGVIVSAANPQVAPLENALKQAQQQLETLLREQATTPAAGTEALGKVLAAETALKQFQLKTLLELRAMLTPEQRTQALDLASKGGMDVDRLQAQAVAEAERLKTSFEKLGVPITEALKERGQEIEKMIREGGFETALKAVERLVTESGINDPAPTDPLDFNHLNPGDTSLETLKSRLEVLKSKAQGVISVQVLQKLELAKNALEQAKGNSDAEMLGKILTFAENLLKQ